MENRDQERKLLEILDSEELPEPAGDSKEALEEGFPDLDEDKLEAMSKIIGAEMLPPEEIEQRARVAQYNAEIQRKREEKLARRAARRAAGRDHRRSWKKRK